MAYLGLVFISLLWGSSFILIKIASREMDALGIAMGRTAVAAAALALLVLTLRMAWPRTAAIWARLALLSVVGQVLPFVMLGFAGKLTSSIDMALMMGAAPLITFLLGRIIPPTEAWSRQAALGMLLGFAGVALALSPSMSGGETQDGEWLGRICALAAAAGYAGGALLSKRIQQDVSATMTVTASMLISLFMMASTWLLMKPAVIPMTGAIALGQPLLALFALGLFNTAVAYVAYFSLIRALAPPLPA